VAKKNREIRCVPEGWEHPKSDDAEAFPSVQWAHASVITRNEMAHDSYMKASLEDRYLGRITPGDAQVNEARMGRVAIYRSAMGLEDGEVFIPLHDQSFEEACEEWESYLLQWIGGIYPDQPDDMDRTAPAFEEWHGPKPAQRGTYSTFRPHFEEPPTCWQLYETISEGTPISPVFYDVNDLYRWMITDGGRDDKWGQEEALELVRGALSP